MTTATAETKIERPRISIGETVVLGLSRATTGGKYNVRPLSHPPVFNQISAVAVRNARFLDAHEEPGLHHELGFGGKHSVVGEFESLVELEPYLHFVHLVFDEDVQAFRRKQKGTGLPVGPVIKTAEVFMCTMGGYYALRPQPKMEAAESCVHDDMV